MSFINYNSEENSLSALRLSAKYKEDFQITEDNGQFQVMEQRGRFVGVKINNFLSELELKGRNAEEVYKQLLDSNQIPYLYIGQGPIGIELSETLHKTTKSKRPDFLINIPDIGVLFVDVKCRRRLRFPKSEGTYFQMYRTEIEQLTNLYSNILIPVWLAFYDEASIPDREKKFYMIPISLLKQYVDGIESKMSERERSMLTCIRIPQELLYKIENEITVKVGHYQIQEDLIKAYANYHKGLIRRIEDEIKSVIRTKDILKSHVPDKVIDSIGSEFFFTFEVNVVLQTMITEETIIYQKQKPLSLTGE